MPLLADLRQTTTPVQITHGSNKFTLDCALEKEAETDASKTTEGATYNDLVAREYELELSGHALQQQVQQKMGLITELGDVDAFRVTLEAERNNKLSARQLKAAEPITFEEIEEAAMKRVNEFQVDIDALRVQVEANNANVKRARAAQVAFLVGSSDIMADEHTPVLCNKVNKTPEQLASDTEVFASFSDVLLDRCVKAVQEAIHGPLVTAG